MNGISKVLKILVFFKLFSCAHMESDLEAPKAEDFGGYSEEIEAFDQEMVLSEFRPRANRNDFKDMDPHSGSLWSGGSANYFFAEKRVKDVGDLVLFVIEDDLHQDMGLKLKEDLSDDEWDLEVIDAEKRILEEAKAKSKKDEEVEPREVSEADINPKFNLVLPKELMAEVMTRYPNGNYKIRTKARIPYRGTLVQFIIQGIARGEDVNDESKILSSRLYEYRVDFAREQQSREN